MALTELIVYRRKWSDYFNRWFYQLFQRHFFYPSYKFMIYLRHIFIDV